MGAGGCGSGVGVGSGFGSTGGGGGGGGGDMIVGNELACTAGARSVINRDSEAISRSPKMKLTPTEFSLHGILICVVTKGVVSSMVAGTKVISAPTIPAEFKTAIAFSRAS